MWQSSVYSWCSKPWRQDKIEWNTMKAKIKQGLERKHHYIITPTLVWIELGRKGRPALTRSTAHFWKWDSVHGHHSTNGASVSPFTQIHMETLCSVDWYYYWTHSLNNVWKKKSVISSLSHCPYFHHISATQDQFPPFLSKWLKLYFIAIFKVVNYE